MIFYRAMATLYFLIGIMAFVSEREGVVSAFVGSVILFGIADVLKELRK